MKNVRRLTAAGVIAALYVVLTVLPPFNAISYGAVQFRLSEALMALSVLSPAGVAGVTVGCFVSNLLSPAPSIFDLTLGTFATLLAGLILCFGRGSFEKRKWLFPIPVILSNGLIVGSYLPFIIMENVTAGAVALTMLSVAAGETAVCYLLGLPLLAAFKKYNIKLF